MIAIIVLLLALFGVASWLTLGLLLPSLFLADTAALWVLYLAVMHLEAARDAGRLPAQAVPLAKAVLYVGLFVDFAYNMTWANVICLDRPRGYLVTQRLKWYRYSGRSSAFQLRLTEWFAAVMLDWADPSGKHV